jgi:Coenzyme PQQ synthesis protein D (PqqD)
MVTTLKVTMARERNVRIRNGDLATRQVGDDVMVLDLRTSQYFAVGGAGTFILGLLQDRDLSVEAIVAELTSAFDVAADRAREDVEQFLHRLDDAGLLETVTR